jgi:ribosomal-protein-alanine N-acetyltransferase
MARQEDSAVILSTFATLSVNSAMHLEAERDRPFAAAQGDIVRHLRLMLIWADKSAPTVHLQKALRGSEFMLSMPPLETERLIIRPFTLDDLDVVHQLLDVDLHDADFDSVGAVTRDKRQQWLRWTVMSYEELAKLYQPPYGDRAVALKETGQVIGACGYVPCFGPFGQLPVFRSGSTDAADSVTERLFVPEFGLFYAFSPAFQRRGYATEAAKALIDYAFGQLNLRRIVATTTYDNVASMGVMRKLGMRIERNPFAEPAWFQVVGMLENIRVM